jgi:hypothetical protein
MKIGFLKFKLTQVIFSLFIVMILIIGSVCLYSDRKKDQARASGNISVQLYDLPTQAKCLPGEITTNGNYIFWIDSRNFPSTQIRGFNIAQSQELTVSSSGNPIAEINCNATYVVWIDNRGANPGIYGYNISTQQEFFIQSQPETGMINGLNISNNYLFWTEYLSIKGYNFSNNQVFTVNIGQNDQWKPQQSGAYVAWERLSQDNMMVKDILFQDIMNQNTYTVTFNPLLTESALAVDGEYLSYLSRDDLTTLTPTGILNFYHMPNQSLTKAVSLVYQNTTITPVKQVVKLGNLSYDPSLHAIVCSVTGDQSYWQLHPYIIDPKLGSNDPPVILPITPTLPIGDFIQWIPECAPNALDYLFISHGDSTADSVYTKLSFYHLSTNTVYPIISSNTAFQTNKKALTVDNRIFLPITLKGVSNRLNVPKYAVVSFDN